MYDAERVRYGAILHPPSLIVHDVAWVKHVHIYGITCISSITDGQYSMCRACVCVCVCVSTLYPINLWCKSFTTVFLPIFAESAWGLRLYPFVYVLHWRLCGAVHGVLLA